jgi:hypothetical protein
MLRVFLNHDILIHFLNAFLAKEGIVITELKYQNTEQLGQKIDDRKAASNTLPELLTLCFGKYYFYSSIKRFLSKRSC